MNLHEFQAKKLFADYGIPTPEGMLVRSAGEAAQAARDLGGQRWVLKAQVHAGGRGKAGGVKVVDAPESLETEAQRLLGSRLVTHQTGAQGLPVEALLVERPVATARELYLGMLVDRTRERVVVMASAAGGMDIEEVAATRPQAILTEAVDPAAGLQPYQCRKLGFALGLETGQLKSFAGLLQSLYRLFTERDASLVEINPLVVTE
ncbi:MAG: acetate--CoA ligase family protein, partial [Gammaproteobacteria bacterium]